MQRRWWLVLAVVAALCGCGQPVEGTAVAGTPEDQFDPCSIPDEAIEATGLDLESKRAGFGDGTSVDDWKRCTWAGTGDDDWYFFTAYASQLYTLDDVRRNPNYSDVTDIVMADRKAVLLRYGSGAPDTGCDAAFEIPGEIVRVGLQTMAGLTPKDSTCDLLLAHLEDLEPHFP